MSDGFHSKEDSRAMRARMDEAYAKRKQDHLAFEKAKKEAQRKAFIEKALAAGIPEKMLEFIEENFEMKGHKHWDGKIG